MATALLYTALVLVRVALAFAPGYIHPDEWFQYGEAVAGDYLDMDVLWTWEFDRSYPCRSMASIRLFSLPFMLIGKEPSARLLFATSRLTFLLYSFVVDWCTWQLLPPSARWKGLTLWAGSGAVLAFSVRSFSNNVEAALLGLCFVALQRLASTGTPSKAGEKQDARWYGWSILLGLLASLGVFSRFTFAVFALPTGLAFVKLAWLRSITAGSRWRTTIRLILGAATSAAVTALLHILYDTRYYSSPQPASLWPPVVVPLNAALYNLKNENLAIHGVHPRWLHFAINAPMILGIGPWMQCVALAVPGRFAMRRAATTIDRVLAITVFTSLAILSVQPHQEPRFLLPLVLPSIVLFSKSKWSGRGIILAATITQSLAVTLFFGLLHQAGTIPAMLDVHDKLQAGMSASHDAPLPLLFWKSFMPPRHLILPVGSKDAVVHDLQSMSLEQLAATISASSSPQQVLFAPLWAINRQSKASLRRRGIALSPLTRPYLHLDTDHLGESIREYQQGQSLRHSFSYGAWILASVD